MQMEHCNSVYYKIRRVLSYLVGQKLVWWIMRQVFHSSTYSLQQVPTAMPDTEITNHSIQSHISVKGYSYDVNEVFILNSQRKGAESCIILTMVPFLFSGRKLHIGIRARLLIN